MPKWIMVVDDDVANLKVAGHILSKNNMRVTALKSGRSMLSYIADNGSPDLILLDIKMPELDGFETLKLLRSLEKEKGLENIPVIFLTANEDAETESRGFEMGVSDYIRKPFDPDVLLRRINNIVSNRAKLQDLKSEATTDKLTGFLNKSATGSEMSKMCSDQTGCLMMIDLDSFKLVNDIYGHDMGDKVLIGFADIIRKNVPEGSRCGRIGGDEFVTFCVGFTREDRVADFTVSINDDLVALAKDLMGPDMGIPLGASVGAIFVPLHGNDYSSLLKLADKSLYTVKKNGKHGYSLYDDDQLSADGQSELIDISTLSEILGERNIPDVALQLDKDGFASVYRYIIRYLIRNHKNACKVLFTLMQPEGSDAEYYKDCLDEFGNHLRKSMRKSDILMRNNKRQYFVLLTDIRAESIDKVIELIISKWNLYRADSLIITYESEFIGNEQ